MGKATNRKPKTQRSLVTEEAAQRGDFRSAGLAQKRIPVIETMLTRKQITDAEYRALAHYSDQAALAERSPIKSCLDNSVGTGEGGHLTAAVTSAILTTARIERELGSLLDICRAVAIDDVSLSQWCVQKHGGRERYDGKGKFIAIVPINEKRHMAIALIDLRMGARRIMAA